jgi:hypothetical protein
MIRVAETRTADVYVHDRCVITRVRGGVVQTLADARENLATAGGACDGEKLPLLVDISRSEPLTPDVRHYYSGDRIMTPFACLAILVDATPFSRMMGNVYLRIARPGIPTKLFTVEEEALRWAKTLAA